MFCSIPRLSPMKNTPWVNSPWSDSQNPWANHTPSRAQNPWKLIPNPSQPWNPIQKLSKPIYPKPIYHPNTSNSPPPKIPHPPCEGRILRNFLRAWDHEDLTSWDPAQSSTLDHLHLSTTSRWINWAQLVLKENQRTKTGGRMVNQPQLVGGFISTHLKKICSSNWIIFLGTQGENKKSWKPPPVDNVMALLPVAIFSAIHRLRRRGSSSSNRNNPCLVDVGPFYTVRTFFWSTENNHMSINM